MASFEHCENDDHVVVDDQTNDDDDNHHHYPPHPHDDVSSRYVLTSSGNGFGRKMKTNFLHCPFEVGHMNDSMKEFDHGTYRYDQCLLAFTHSHTPHTNGPSATVVPHGTSSTSQSFGDRPTVVRSTTVSGSACGQSSLRDHPTSLEAGWGG